MARDPGGENDLGVGKPFDMRTGRMIGVWRADPRISRMSASGHDQAVRQQLVQVERRRPLVEVVEGDDLRHVGETTPGTCDPLPQIPVLTSREAGIEQPDLLDSVPTDETGVDREDAVARELREQVPVAGGRCQCYPPAVSSHASPRAVGPDEIGVVLEPRGETLETGRNEGIVGVQEQ